VLELKTIFDDVKLTFVQTNLSLVFQNLLKK